MSTLLRAVVKSVISGDSLVLRGRAGPQGQPPKERILYLADVTAPRLGTSSREDEPWAYDSREYLRTLVVGKEVSFTSVHSLEAGEDSSARDIGSAEVNGVDITSELLRNGWVKLKELKREPTEEDNKRKELENEAKTANKGIWAGEPPKRVIHHNMPVDSTAFLTEWKGKFIDGIVEQVRDGTTLRIRLLLSPEEHQIVNIQLAGVKSPRISSKQGETSEPFAEEAKFFTESRLLQRGVRVTILSFPTSTATPFQSSATAAAPTSASIFIGTVLHPAGNVSEHLVAAGLVRIVDWHAGMLAANGGMERLRAAERTAKERRANLFASALAPSAAKPTTTNNGQSRVFDATVVRVWSGDQITVLDKETQKERRIQLSSVRAPKATDPKQAHYAQDAREFLRKKLIGKNVKVTIDFIRPPEGDFEERECATVRFGGHNANVAEQIIEKGLAGVVRHKRDDENRSSDYDKLMVAEQSAVTATRGIHSGKELPPTKQSLNISETHSRAVQYLNGFKRLGKIPAVVEYVAAGSRFKIYLPKEHQVLTLVLGGIRAPKTARNASEKDEAYGPEALAFATHRYMQRDVEFEVETVDKSGGFIGALYVNKTENAAVSLAKEGLAEVHLFSADGLPWSTQLYNAEAEAKKEKRNIWTNYDDTTKAAEVVAEPSSEGPLKTEYLDVIVSDVRPKTDFSFSVQILNTEGIASLEKLMHEFSLHHKGAFTNPPGWVPKSGELVSAKFSDGAWYRAKIRRASPVKKEAEITFIDYGNQETVSFSNIRPLDPKFRSLPGQAHDARLSFIKLAGPETEYHADAVDRFRVLCEGRKLVANVDHKEGNLLHLRLIDPTNPASANDPLECVNADLLREGVASIDRKGCKYLNLYPPVMKELRESIAEAKRNRLGMFEFGDVEEDDD